MKHPHLDVIYAGNLQPGDLLAGEVNPGNTSRPVIKYASAMPVETVRKVEDDDGVTIVHHTTRLGDGSFAGTPHPITQQLLIIRLPDPTT